MVLILFVHTIPKTVTNVSLILCVRTKITNEFFQIAISICKVRFEIYDIRKIYVDEFSGFIFSSNRIET